MDNNTLGCTIFEYSCKIYCNIYNGELRNIYKGGRNFFGPPFFYSEGDGFLFRLKDFTLPTYRIPQRDKKPYIGNDPKPKLE